MPRIRDLASHSYPFVTVEELADYLMVSTKTVYRQIEKGALNVVRVGDAIRIPIQEARQYVGASRSNDDTSVDGNGLLGLE